MRKSAAWIMVAMMTMAYALSMLGCAAPEQSSTETPPAETEHMNRGGMTDTSMMDTTMTEGHEGGDH